MLLALLSHAVGAWFALLLPAYATFKAIAHNPDNLKSLAMYWSILAFFLAFEHSIGPIFSWLPFYWELRTVFLLYIALPQTQGSTYLYTTLVHPWLSNNEANIDTAIASAQSNALTFCRSRVAALLDLATNSTRPHSSTGADTSHPVDQLQRLWAAHAPSFFAAFAPKALSDAHVTSTVKDGHKSQPTN